MHGRDSNWSDCWATQSTYQRRSQCKLVSWKERIHVLCSIRHGNISTERIGHLNVQFNLALDVLVTSMLFFTPSRDFWIGEQNSMLTHLDLWSPFQEKCLPDKSPFPTMWISPSWKPLLVNLCCKIESYVEGVCQSQFLQFRHHSPILSTFSSTSISILQ